jgi:hypothetical protein
MQLDLDPRQLPYIVTDISPAPSWKPPACTKCSMHAAMCPMHAAMCPMHASAPFCFSTWKQAMPCTHRPLHSLVGTLRKVSVKRRGGYEPNLAVTKRTNGLLMTHLPPTHDTKQTAGI